MNLPAYPYQNTSMVSIKGETWKDVRDFEGYYQVSSLGRVKSLDRVIPHARLKTQFIAGRILTQQVKETPNLKTGEPSIALQVALSQDGTLYYRNVKRLVYAAFIRDIDYERDGKYVININGDGLDNRVGNLKLMTKSEKGKRAFQRDRADSTFLKTADRSTWNRPQHPFSKPVCQYDMEGKLIACYKSVNEASIKTGCGHKEITLVARGVHRQTRGFGWKYEEK